MITKERLEELKKECATIYWLAGKMVLNIHLDSSYYVSDANILCHKRSEDEKNCVEYIENLYETKEQAEWALKYYATRTEELTLPTFEEFITYNENECVAFVGEDWEVYELSKDYDLITEDWCINLTKGGMGEYEWQATEENYIKACNLCLKLFKGEEK